MSQKNNPGQYPWVLISAAAVVSASIAAGFVLGRGAVMITLAAGTVLAAITLFWQSLNGLSGTAPLSLEEALGFGAQSAEEERKQSVLRILKDLEYERAVGKLSDQDYLTLATKYRSEAMALLAVVDENLGPAREEAEAEFGRYLAERAGAAGKPAAADNGDATSAEDTRS